MNTRFISLLLTVISFYNNIQGQDYLLNWPVDQNELPVHCSFGEIHPDHDHFHGGIDIYIADSPVYAVEDGFAYPGTDGIIIIHNNNRRTQYLHLTHIYVSPGDNVTPDSAIGMMGNHLHFEMRQTVNNIEFRLNPLGNDLWMLDNTPNDDNDPQINDVYIEPLRNENNNVGSGFDIDDNATGITAPNDIFDGYARVHLQDRPQGQNITEYILNSEDYNVNKLIVFGNIGLIVNTRDVRINSNGCGRGLTIKDISYSIHDPFEDETTRKFLIDFDRIPQNLPLSDPDYREYIFHENELYLPQYIFHTEFNEGDGRLFGNNDYIEMRVTNDNNDGFVYSHKPLPYNGQHVQSNGIWFTKAHNTTDHVFEQTPTNVAAVNAECLYPDGVYVLQFDVHDAAGNTDNDNTDVQVIVDNFKPYIEKVLIRQENSTGQRIYQGGWDYINGTLTFDDQHDNDAIINEQLWIKVFTSEPMEELTLDAFGSETTNGDPLENTNRKQWIFTRTPTIAGNDQILNFISSQSHDIAGNRLEGFNNINDIPGTSIPRRQNDGSWLYANGNNDESHKIDIISDVELVADFSYEHDGDINYTINFTDKSTPQDEIHYWEWDFGDGNLSHEQNPSHSYTPGEYEVNLRVCTSSGETNCESVSSTVNVAKIEPPKADFSYNINVNNMDNTIVVDFFSTSTGAISDYYWDFDNETGITESTKKNPSGIIFYQDESYNVKLTVSNIEGDDTKAREIYHSSDENAYLDCFYDGMEFSYRFTLQAINMDPLDNGNYEYSIDFGDGNKHTRNSILNSIIVDHTYIEADEYTYHSSVKGIDPITGEEVEKSCAGIVYVKPWQLEMNINMSSNTPQYFLPCSPITFNAHLVNGDSDAKYNWRWTINKPDGSNYTYVAKSFCTGTIMEPFTIEFPEPGTYPINVEVSGNGGYGVENTQVNITSVPQQLFAVIAGFSSPVGIGEHTFYSNSYSNDRFLPTNYRWKVYDEEGNKVDEELKGEFAPDAYNDEENRAVTLSFPESGTYTITHEAWNKNCTITPSEMNECGKHKYAHYDIASETIEVDANIPVIALSEKEKRISCSGQTISFEVSNSGGGELNWALSSKAYELEPVDYDWVKIESGSSGINTGTVTLSVDKNTSLQDRDAHIYILSDYASNSPEGFFLKQLSPEGPKEELINAGNHANKDDRFGFSVALDGSYAVIGAIGYNNDKGAAFVYKKEEGFWKKKAKLTADGTNRNDKFGYDVDIDGEYIIVGCLKCRTSEGNRRGAAFIYKKPPGGEWTSTGTYKKKLKDPYGNRNADFGCAVAISGDYAVVGARYDDGDKNKEGSASIYFRDEGGADEWGRVKKMKGDGRKDQFGHDVDIDGDRVIVGAPEPDDMHGYIKIYKRNNNWGFINKFIYDWDGMHSEYWYKNKNNRFGRSVAINNNRILVGDRFYYKEKVEDNIIFDKWVHVKNGNVNMYLISTNGELYFDGSWSHPSINSGAYGKTIGIFNNIGIIGDKTFCSHGSAYTIDLIEWGDMAKLPYANFFDQDINTNTGDNFGNSVDVNQGNAICGIPGDDDKGEDAGSVYFAHYPRIYSMPDFSVCDIQKEFINFVKLPGDYQDVVAGDITIGGSGYDAVYEDGANITYKAGRIVLEDGFTAEDGFVAEAVNCQDYVSSNPGVPYDNLKSSTLKSTMKSTTRSTNSAPLQVSDLDYINPKEDGIYPLRLNNREDDIIVAFDASKETPVNLAVKNLSTGETIIVYEDSPETEFSINLQELPVGLYKITASRGDKEFESQMFRINQ